MDSKKIVDEIERLYGDVDGYESWDQKIQYNQKERAKMILDTLDDEPELQMEFNLQLRQRKLKKIKQNNNEKRIQ